MKTRSKLMAALAMLLVSTIMMTTASFAWFTISTAPEVEAMEAGVVSNDNLEIALVEEGNTLTVPQSGGSASGNYYTWGNLVDLGATSLTGAQDGGNDVKTTMGVALRPAALANNAFTAPAYGSDGRVSNETGVAISSSTGYGHGTLVGDDGETYGYYVDFWVRTNKGGYNLGLTTEVETHTGGGMGCGSEVVSDNEFTKKQVKVAFAKLGEDDGNGTAPTTTSEDAKVEATNTEGVLANNAIITNMTANTAYLVRVYVYLDGASITNATETATATVNLQFALYNGDTKVDMTSMTIGTATEGTP